MLANSGSTKAANGDLKQTRRRLSVMSDNKLIEGIDHVNLAEDPPVVSLIQYCIGVELKLLKFNHRQLQSLRLHQQVVVLLLILMVVTPRKDMLPTIQRRRIKMHLLWLKTPKLEVCCCALWTVMVKMVTKFLIVLKGN